MNIYSLDSDQLSKNLNNAYDLLYDQLEKDGIEIKKRYRVLAKEKSFFGKVVEKLFTKDDDGLKYFLVEVIS